MGLFLVDELETRSLLSGFGRGFGLGRLGGLGGLGFGANSNPAVQADLAKIQQDRQKLQLDTTNTRPTLLRDQADILTAINNSPAKPRLTADQAKWRSTLRADQQAIAAATDSTTRAADTTKFLSDRASAFAALQADRTAITNDPNVRAAKQRLQADSRILVTDRATLLADRIQLQKDLGAQSGQTT